MLFSTDGQRIYPIPEPPNPNPPLGAQDPKHVNFLLATINPNVDANLLKTNNKKISKMHKRLINT